MSRSILIVEDNEGVASLLEELCAQANATSVRVRGGSEAISLLRQGLPDVLVTDLVLAELDGFQVASAARELPGGADLPIVVISGVYKRLPEAFEHAVKVRFFPKPFDPREVSDLIRSVVSAKDAADGIERGRLHHEGPSSLLVRLASRGVTGLLDFSDGRVRRRVYLESGRIRHAVSNLRQESAGAMQVASGKLREAAFDRALAHAKQVRVPLHEALAATRALTPPELTEALATQTREVATNALAMFGAEWTFTRMDVDRQPNTPLDSVVPVIEHARRTMSAPEARAALSRMASGRVVRSELLEREAFAVRSEWPGETVLGLAAARPELAQWLSRAAADELPLAWALVTSGLVTLESEETPADRPGASPSLLRRPASHPITETSLPEGPTELERKKDEGRAFSEEEERARNRVFAERARLAGLNHYETLGISRESAPEEARRAYVELAKRFHPDTYSGLDLGSAREVAEELFLRIREAVETLSEPSRRTEYDLLLERRDAGLPTDLTSVLEAEACHKRGETLMTAGRPVEALEAFRESVARNPDSPISQAWLGLALYRARGSEAVEEARGHLRAALERAPELPEAYCFLGVLARDEGSAEEATVLFERTLELDPRNAQAREALKTLRRPGNRKDGRSLFGRLLGRR